MPYRSRKLLNCRMKLEVNYPMTDGKFWLVHFYRDKEDNYGETEELSFPTDVTRENILKAMEEAEKVCEENGFLFAALDLVWDNWTKFYMFPRDLMKIK